MSLLPCLAFFTIVAVLVIGVTLALNLRLILRIFGCRRVLSLLVIVILVGAWLALGSIERYLLQSVVVIIKFQNFLSVFVFGLP